MNDSNFILGHLPFWIVNYALAVVIWSCIGRFVMSFFMPGVQPKNYIWRAFVRLTEWAVIAASWITPRYVRPIFLPPIAAFWLFHLRIAIFFALWRAGLTPILAPAG